MSSTTMMLRLARCGQTARTSCLSSIRSSPAILNVKWTRRINSSSSSEKNASFGHSKKRGDHESNKNNKNHNETTTRDQRKKQVTKSPTQELAREVARLRSLFQELTPLVPLWQHSEKTMLERDYPYPHQHTPQSHDSSSLCHDTRRLVQRIEQLMQQNRNAVGARELSVFLGEALTILSSCSSDYEDCRNVLDLLKRYNLHLPHYHHAIHAAALQQDWKEAASLFRQQIDPDAMGYTPMEISVVHPLGLYAIAKHAQQTNQPYTAEQVMDAVMSLTMVSPTDQDKYVLAAGNALGQAGEWKSLLQYLETSYDSSRLGLPLVAATMQACLLNEQHEEAWKLYGTFGGKMGHEWQWGGGASLDPAHAPLIHDLAMRAATTKEDAMPLFREAHRDGTQISIQAVHGVLRSSWENWPNALYIMSKLLMFHITTTNNNNNNNNWLVDGNHLSIEPVSRVNATEQQKQQQQQYYASPKFLQSMQQVLVTFFQICNYHQQFGTTLLVCRLMVPHKPGTTIAESRAAQQEELEGLTRSLWDTLHQTWSSQLTDNHPLLPSIMTALTGLGCANHSVRLYKTIPSSLEEPSSHAARDCYEFAQKEEATTVTTQGPFEMAYLQMDHLLQQLESAPSRNDVLLALSKIMRACCAAQQAEAGLLFSDHVIRNMVLRPSSAGSKMNKKDKGKTRDDFTMSLFFGMDDDKKDREDGVVEAVVGSNDALLSEYIRAYRSRGSSHRAMQFFDRYRKDDYVHSANQALTTLLQEGRKKEAIRLFRSIKRTPETFLSMAKAFEQNEEWNMVGDLYHLALRQDCLSEELCVLAMTSVCADTSFDGKLRVLRGIVREASRLMGLDKSRWQQSRYWTLKRKLGWHHARLLMWWNHAQTAPLMELQLALQQLSTANRAPKNDALRAIVKYCKRHNQLAQPIATMMMSTTREDDETVLPVEPAEWLYVLTQVIVASSSSSLQYDANFVHDVVEALVSLQAREECVEYVEDAIIQRSVRVHAKTLDLIHSIATRQGWELSDSISMLLQE